MYSWCSTDGCNIDRDPKSTAASTELLSPLFFSGQLGEWKWVRNPLSSVNFLWTGESVIAVWQELCRFSLTRNSVDAISVWCRSTPGRQCGILTDFFIEILVNVRQNPVHGYIVLVVRLNPRAPEPPLVYRWKSMMCCVFMWGMESEM